MGRKRIVKDQCYLTGEIRGLAHNDCILNTRKTHPSFVPTLSHNFSGQDAHPIFEKIVIMTIEEDIKINGEDLIAKSSKN